MWGLSTFSQAKASRAISTSKWFGIRSSMYGSRLQSSGSVFLERSRAGPWSGIDREKKKRRTRSKPSEVECCCPMHAQCCGRMRCLPSTVFSFPVYLIGCCLSFGHTDWRFWHWLPPRNKVVKQCQNLILNFSKWAHWLSAIFMICSLWRWPSKTDSIFNTFKHSETKNACGTFQGVGLHRLCLCLRAIEHPWQTPPHSIWPSSTAPYIDLDPVHLDIPPPCRHSYTYIHPYRLSPSSPSLVCPSCLAFLQSRNRSSGKGRVIADSPPASASLGRCVFASRRVVTLFISPVPPCLA